MSESNKYPIGTRIKITGTYTMVTERYYIVRKSDRQGNFFDPAPFSEMKSIPSDTTYTYETIPYTEEEIIKLKEFFGPLFKEKKLLCLVQKVG